LRNPVSAGEIKRPAVRSFGQFLGIDALILF
jgi:hypothetical protein